MRPILQITNQNKTNQHLANIISERMKLTTKEIQPSDLDNINTIIEQQDAALLIIGLDNNNQIQ